MEILYTSAYIMAVSIHHVCFQHVASGCFAHIYMCVCVYTHIYSYVYVLICLCVSTHAYTSPRKRVGYISDMHVYTLYVAYVARACGCVYVYIYWDLLACTYTCTPYVYTFMPGNDYVYCSCACSTWRIIVAGAFIIYAFACVHTWVESSAKCWHAYVSRTLDLLSESNYDCRCQARLRTVSLSPSVTPDLKSESKPDSGS